MVAGEMDKSCFCTPGESEILNEEAKWGSQSGMRALSRFEQTRFEAVRRISRQRTSIGSMYRFGLPTLLLFG